MAGVHTHLQEEHLKAWLRDAYPAKTYVAPPPQPDPMNENGRTNPVHLGERFNPYETRLEGGGNISLRWICIPQPCL